MSGASSPHISPEELQEALRLARYTVDNTELSGAGLVARALISTQEQFETAQNAMKEALAALMVGQPDRPRALHNAERILRAALAKRLEIETSHEPSQMDWPEGTPHVL